MTLLRVEFHSHTSASPDSLTTPEKFAAACRRKGIDRVVITDHNTIRGARAAQQLAPELVIVGEEIMTQQGELLAAFVSHEVPRGLPAPEAVRLLREQGAFISVSHPFDVTRSGHWRLPDLLAIVPLVDAVEIFNARCLSVKFNERARRFAAQHGLAGTAGSDAHTAAELGNAVMRLPAFEDAQGLRLSLREAQYELNRAPLWVRFGSRFASAVSSVRRVPR
jgi:predicted metal-dependent phosphoesterase TrpH